jgi:hypothetical protein
VNTGDVTTPGTDIGCYFWTQLKTYRVSVWSVGWVTRGEFGIATEGGNSGVLNFKVPVELVSVHKNT